jgi:L-seryl-tRNA(Ser) seleniumtransferase
MAELQRKVGERIAALTRNEAGYISSGAAGGIVVAVAACITGADPDLIAQLPYLDNVPRNEVIIHTSQRNNYDFAARQTGARIVEIEGTPKSLKDAIGERTAAVLYFAGAHFATNALPLEQVIAIAHERGVPVLVDGAAQIPAISNLWHYTRDLGADIAIFSGGKGLRGPQSSGLVLGRADLIEGCRANGSPNSAVGRPMKVGKEELFGILAAVEWSLAQDEAATIAGYEATVQMWLDGLKDEPGVIAERGYPSEAGQPYPRAIVHFAADSGLTKDAVVNALWEGNPRVAVGAVGEAIALNPQTLEPGEAEIVLEALKAALGQ